MTTTHSLARWLLSALILVVQPAYADALADQTDVHNRITALLDARSFAELDAQMDAARKSHSTAPDGTPLLQLYYSAFTVNCGCTEHSIAEPDALQWVRWRQALEQWRRLAPQSINAQILYATYHISYGEYARGTDYAKDVRPDQWKMMQTYLDRAATLLQSMSGPAREDRGWYAAKLRLLRLQGIDNRHEYVLLWQEATQKYPDYLPLYTLAAGYFEPRWMGSEQEEKALIEHAVALTQSFWGESLYARLYARDMRYDQTLDPAVDWPRMRKGFERVVHDFPAAVNYSQYARFACQYGDLKALRSAVKHIDSAQPLIHTWGYSRDLFNRCMAYAKSGTANKKPV
ncbi:DUF4034 domain-containing protein [Amantichitinum ursilacus]|uniref:DUF4034 domain-containing protein n=1 Tax=Amantichitinum ursilacus TaxID=857265 RepID=A0A0N0XGT9_9NEIS|nr:DUF4034 domain-containing protein [Amantichitinum ursilacus]KPC50178.1 hypothetical protein WG78_18275 [Amantichitinum ursilacus]